MIFINQVTTGNIIRVARLEHNITQNQLAEKLSVSDKAISKLERGCGAPDISLSLNVNTLLCGEINEIFSGNGSLKKINFYICPVCGNILFSHRAHKHKLLRKAALFSVLGCSRYKAPAQY